MTNGKPTVGFIGLGIMGSRMAANLRRAGHDLVVFNRTRATADAWAKEHGATVAATPAEVAKEADVVITMVVDGPQVEAVLLGEEGVVHGAREGLLCVDMSTISPTHTRRIGAALAERGIHFMDAPVTGSSPKAEDGTLTIMAGGEAEDFERARPLFDAMGALIVHAGRLGDGEMVKLINNAVAAVNAATVGEALSEITEATLEKARDKARDTRHSDNQRRSRQKLLHRDDVDPRPVEQALFVIDANRLKLVSRV